MLFRSGSTSFLAYYLCALEEFRATADAQERYIRLDPPAAAEIRRKLEQSVTLMPDYAPAQELFGFFEMVQGEQLAEAGRHLQRAIQLEPETLSYLLALAQLQSRTRNLAAARQTLAPLLQPNAPAKLRSAAEKLMQEINHR